MKQYNIYHLITQNKNSIYGLNIKNNLFIYLIYKMKIRENLQNLIGINLLSDNILFQIMIRKLKFINLEMKN